MVSAAFLLAAAVPASADLIARWDFNAATTGTPPAYQTPSTGSGSLGYASTGSATVTFSRQAVNTLDDTPANSDPASGTSDYALRIAYSQIYNVDSGVTFSVSTAGFTGITMTLDVYRDNSSTPIYYRLYAYDGSNWITAGDRIAFIDTNGWHTAQTYDLSFLFPSLANNNANFMVGFFEDGKPMSSMTSAYSIIDYVSFNGTPQVVPIPGAVWLLGSGLLGLVAFRRRFRK